MSRVFVLQNRFNHSIHFVRTPCINVHVYAIPDRGEQAPRKGHFTKGL